MVCTHIIRVWELMFRIPTHAWTYGWFGCSGSLVYDQDGKAIGILWGIDIQNGLPQENMIWVAPIQNLNMELALKTVCDSMPEKPRACK